MRDTLTDSVARLHRAGSEHSKQTQKLRDAANKILLWIKENIPPGFTLPLSCQLYPNGVFIKRSGNVPLEMSLGSNHTREQLFKFSSLINDGFLEKLTDSLEVESRAFAATVEKIETSSQCSNSNPLQLTVSGFWDELAELRRSKELPAELTSVLQSLIESHTHHAIPPEAKSTEIAQAKKHLGGGILLKDSGMDRLYDVTVFIPDPGKEKSVRTFFRLIPKYSGGKLRHLHEV